MLWTLLNLIGLNKLDSFVCFVHIYLETFPIAEDDFVMKIRICQELLYSTFSEYTSSSMAVHGDMAKQTKYMTIFFKDVTVVSCQTCGVPYLNGYQGPPNSTLKFR